MARIAKVISNAGLCSRRDAERWIAEGRVKLDGKLVETPVTLVSDENIIEVDGEKIPNIQNKKPRIWCYHKPVGLITTHNDEHGRPTVFDSITGLPRVISVGRLDLNSEGLLLLTNDGALARTLELPQTGLRRVYKVRAFGNPQYLLKARFPIVIDRMRYNPVSIKVTKKSPTNSWYEVVLQEGKNREIREIFSHFDLKVNRLIRTEYGPFALGDLEPGEYSEQKFESFEEFLK